jgi:TonB family protein
MMMMSSQRTKLIARIALAALIAAGALDSPAMAQGAATDKLELPPYKGTLKDDYYPADARQHFLQGRALLEFALNGRGAPTDVALVNAEPPHEFEDAARRLVQNLRFEVPAGWQQSAAAAHRFRMGVRFEVIECINLSKCESQARHPPADYDGADRTYVVTSQQRVLTFDSSPPPPPAPLPRPRDTGASPEPDYPPG